MDQWAFFDEIKNGTIRNVYFFYGPEDLIRKKAIAALEKNTQFPGLEDINRTVLSGATAQQIIESCETLPMMSDYRLIIVRDLPIIASGKAKDEQEESALLCDYLQRVPQTTCLVFDAGSAVDKRKKLSAALLKLPGAVSFDALDDVHLFRWMNQNLRPYGKRLSREGCETLAFTSGRDLTMLEGELGKLAAYAGDREEITPEDVERIATHTAESTVFAMSDAIAEGRAKDAFSYLNILLQSGEQRIGILAMITRQYRQLMYIAAMQEQRVPTGQIAKTIGAPGFAMNRLLRQVGRRSATELHEKWQLCVDTDYDIKRGALRDDAALERLMLRLLETKKS